jgi:hypothetical protein
MSTRYLANGIQLSSAFPLPGMLPAHAEGMPSLGLARVGRAELRAAWSGPEGPPAWRGRLGDGLGLTIEIGIEGAVLFTYGERALFLLDPLQRLLSCAPSAEGLDWQRTLLTKVLPTVSVILGYEALHASAVDSPRGIIAILAPSGMGKTTLALELMRRGWPLVSDDILTLGATPDGVLAYPGTPHMNLAENHPDSTAHRFGSTLGILGGERWLATPASSHRPRPVYMVCLLERRSALSLESHRLTPSPLVLAPYMLGLPDDQARQRRRFALYADLASSATMLRITSGPAEEPGDLADLIDSELDVAAPRHAIGSRA